MEKKIKYCVIVGSSRGLGAALVEEFIKQTSCQIIGIARTKLNKIDNHERWIASGRYRHVEMDIGEPQCRDILKSLSYELPHEPICVIFNCAHIEKDINKDDLSINYIAFDNINRVGINGLGNILFAFEDHLLKYGGILVGISSFWGGVPPLFLPWMAYPASKAYLNTAFRCLRVAWRKHVEVVLVNIGNIDNKSSLPKWIVPTYTMAAQKIVKSILKQRTHKIINYPFWHSIVYQYILKYVPEVVYCWIFELYFKLEALKKGYKRMT